MQDGLPDPPDRVGDELDVLVGIELFRGVDQSDVPLVDEVEEEHMRVAVLFRVGDDKAEVGLDQLLERGLVVVLLNALTQLALPLRRQPRHLRDFVKILIQEIVRVVSLFVSGHVFGNRILTLPKAGSTSPFPLGRSRHENESSDRID